MVLLLRVMPTWKFFLQLRNKRSWRLLIRLLLMKLPTLLKWSKKLLQRRIMRRPFMLLRLSILLMLTRRRLLILSSPPFTNFRLASSRQVGRKLWKMNFLRGCATSTICVTLCIPFLHASLFPIICGNGISGNLLAKLQLHLRTLVLLPPPSPSLGTEGCFQFFVLLILSFLLLNQKQKCQLYVLFYLDLLFFSLFFIYHPWTFFHGFFCICPLSLSWVGSLTFVVFCDLGLFFVRLVISKHSWGFSLYIHILHLGGWYEHNFPIGNTYLNYPMPCALQLFPIFVCQAECPQVYFLIYDV